MHRHRTHVFRDSRFLFRPFLILDDAGANLSAANGSVPSESRMHLYNCVTHHRSSVAAPSEQNVLDDHGSLPGSENDPPRRWSRQENDSAAQKRPTPIAVRQGAVLQSVPQIVWGARGARTDQRTLPPPFFFSSAQRTWSLFEQRRTLLPTSLAIEFDAVARSLWRGRKLYNKDENCITKTGMPTVL